MNRDDQVFMKCLRGAVLLLVFALAAVPALAQTSAPTAVDSGGYINGTALATHTTAAFNSTGSWTLVAFVSTHPSWNGLPVSIGGLSDNVGNTWNVLVGPTTWTGSSYTLTSAIYYVNVPATSATHTLTVNLTNAAPLVAHVVAVSGSDITGPPIYSFITDPGPGPSTDVISQAITVPANTLLLAWVKNENVATATALDGWTLDSASTSFLWAAYRTALSASAYDGHFSYSNPIGWQTAIVGVTAAPPGPAAQSQSVITNQDTPVNITLTAVSPNNFPLTYTVLAQPTHGQLSGVAPDLTYTPNAGYSGDDSFTFKANDGTADSNVAIVSITVRPPNQAPVAQNGTVTVEVGTTAAIALSASDPDNDPLTYTVLTSPAHGLLSGTAPSLTYTPNAGYVGGDSFTFKANDGTTDSNVAQVDISVTAGAPRPAVVSRTGYINGTPLTGHTTAAFNSTGSSTLVAFVSTHPSWNGLPVSIGGLSDNVGNTWNVLVGPTTWAGSSFTLMSAIYYVNVPATSATHTLTVNLTNAAPLVAHVFAVSGSDITGPPLYSPITDPGPGPSTDVISQAITVSADTLLLAWVKNESNATATALDSWTLDSASTSFLWAEYQTAVSAGDYYGHFSYSAFIGWQTAIVGVKPAPVAPVNQGPVASNGSVTTNEDVPVTGTLTATDADGDDALTFSIVANGTKGTATVTNAATGAYTYTPRPNVNGTDTFTFKANDGLIDSNVATVTVTITPVNDAAPVASNGSVTTKEDVRVTGTLTATDADGDPLTFSIVANGTKGTATITNPATGAFAYTPLPNVNGTDTFTFKANDGLIDSNVATVTVTITPVNDAPVAASASYTTKVNTSFTATLGATDVEGDPLTFAIASSPKKGRVVIDPGTGRFTYTPAAGATKIDSFTFRASDGKRLSNTAKITISIVK